jgi:hypothetical protein
VCAWTQKVAPADEEGGDDHHDHDHHDHDDHPDKD